MNGEGRRYAAEVLAEERLLADYETALRVIERAFNAGRVSGLQDAVDQIWNRPAPLHSVASEHYACNPDESAGLAEGRE